MYSVGGFTLPFFVVGSTSLVLGFCLCLVLPDIEGVADKEDNNNNKENAESLDKKLTLGDVFRVSSGLYQGRQFCKSHSFYIRED